MQWCAPVLALCCSPAAVPVFPNRNESLFFFSDSGVVSPFSQQTVTEKYEFVRSFLRFVLALPTLELKCHLMPFAVSLRVFIIQPTTPWWCASQEAQYRASNLFICGGKKKGKLIHWLSALEVLYLSTDPNIWLVQPGVHCPIVCGAVCERRLFLKHVCAGTHMQKWTHGPCVSVFVCVSLGT